MPVILQMHNVKMLPVVLSFNNQIHDTPITFWDIEFAGSETPSKSLTVQKAYI